jgi:adhesin transport system membrane fusion protein
VLSHILVQEGQAVVAGQELATLERARPDAAFDESRAKLAALTLKPGMTATVDIRTDSRSILQYLAKPVFKAFGGALNER